MRAAKAHIDGLIELHRMEDGAARAAVFRQSVAALAAEAVDLRPAPLEGLDPVDLETSIRVAIGQGLLDDLGWLSTSHAAAALYELAGALPIGDLRRELGRRVLQRLHEGNAETFAILAAKLSVGSRKVLSNPPVRARVALALEGASSTQGRAATLALSLVSQPELMREWLVLPSSGALASRRLAARVLECAALEVVRRAARGDDYVLAVFDRPEVTNSLNRLLVDREPLVWRRAAIARGLLCGVLPHLAEHIEESLDPERSSTEWRRGAVSLASHIAVEPESALSRCQELLRGEILQREPAIASSMVFGLAWAVEAEPDAANALLETLVAVGNLETLEAFGSLRRDVLGAQFVTTASEAAKRRIASPHFARADDDARTALLRAVSIELGADPNRNHASELGAALNRARLAYLEQDARAAHALGLEVLARAAASLDALVSACATSEGRQLELLALRELDRTLLESQALLHLLWLGCTAPDAAPLRAVHALSNRLGDWLMAREGPLFRAEDTEHIELRARRLRALLHFVDQNLTVTGDKPSQLRDERLKMARLLIGRLKDGADPSVRRVVCAATARACDALLGEELVELSDVLILAATHLADAKDLSVLSEASMEPATARLLAAYARFVQRTSKASQMTGRRMRVGLENLGVLIRAFPALATPRVEALREALVAFADVAHVLQAATSLAALASDEELGSSHLSAFADAVSLLIRLVTGARRRMGDKLPEAALAGEPALRGLDIALAHALREDDPRAMQPAVELASAVLREALPPHLANVAVDALSHVASIPVASPFAAELVAAPAQHHRGAPLPPWLPPNRVVGGFYVIRALGTGSVGSVFVVCRAEEREIHQARRFALKVPEYGGDVARTLSQEEFLRLFREEAGALLVVPDHPNLARLVTFDAGARPKPVLVMELVEGLTLQRLIDTAALDVAGAFDLLDGVAAGLEAMHAVGVGHLDLKPSNVILRDPDRGRASAEEFLPLTGSSAQAVPVLVDFGLAGRTIRPGCATVQYGAPELWGFESRGAPPTPAHVDIYAFGCLIYETLFGHELFDAPTQMAVISKHLRQDGNLPVLSRMMQRTDLSPLVSVIRGAIRRDCADRASLAELRADLREAGKELAGRAWPLSLEAAGRGKSMKDSMSQALPLVRKRGK